ncbi:hypothetical protein SAMN05216189_103037 [Pseudomonas delhiensis]|uniref:Uncharacterized protein n=1 Tax=Pseudomonas delhiensis TaxID=366289 RepID=A0A239IDU9_9PSED|nr:hypothetical protein [Pseudomonas delhiensis]SDK15704.1 hypothetical protein SAMN05216189_103037 [Pseudomonas delhiensis]SNS90604.1 hypothetical protein SAMN06295949_109143 [Pseudomonas delhiensis]
MPVFTLIAPTANMFSTNALRVYNYDIGLIGIRAELAGVSIDMASLEADIYPVLLAITGAKINIDHTVLKVFRQRINMGKLELNSQDLTVYL